MKLRDIWNMIMKGAGPYMLEQLKHVGTFVWYAFEIEGPPGSKAELIALLLSAGRFVLAHGEPTRKAVADWLAEQEAVA